MKIIKNEIEKLTLPTGKFCSLIRIRNEFIPNYYLLAFPETQGEPSSDEISQMLQVGISYAQNLAYNRFGDKESFSVLYSGYSTRREKGWHIHIVLLGNRWRKAWLYLVLAGKNILQALKLRRDAAPISN